jgi:hypothetical protein
LEKGRNKILLLLLFLHTHPQEVLLDLLLRLTATKQQFPFLIQHFTQEEKPNSLLLLHRASLTNPNFSSSSSSRSFVCAGTKPQKAMGRRVAAAVADVSLFLSSKSMMRARK